MNCEKHGVPMIEHPCLMPGMPPLRSCPECDLEMESHMARREALLAAEAEIRMLKAMRIEPEHQVARLATYIATTDAQLKAVAQIRRLVAGEISEVLMVGGNGTGKTHLAVAALWELARAGKAGEIWTMYEISARIRASYTLKAREDELSIVESLASLPALVIDEIGRTKGSDAELGWMSYIIDKRHTRRLPLILISNKHLKRECPAKGCDTCIENWLGEDSMSRLAEAGIVIRFAWEDFRKARRFALKG